MTSLTRRYHFPASHRLNIPHLSTERNAALFGKCNNPFGHGHNYTVSVTVAGEPDARTGLIVSLATLDDLVQTHILERFAYRYLNLDVPEFSVLVPTTENVAAVIVNTLQSQWGRYFDSARVQLHRVHVQETDRNTFEILLSDASGHGDISRERESEKVHA